MILDIKPIFLSAYLPVHVLVKDISDRANSPPFFNCSIVTSTSLLISFCLNVSFFMLTISPEECLMKSFGKNDSSTTSYLQMLYHQSSISFCRCFLIFRLAVVCDIDVCYFMAKNKNYYYCYIAIGAEGLEFGSWAGQLGH